MEKQIITFLPLGSQCGWAGVPHSGEGVRSCDLCLKHYLNQHVVYVRVPLSFAFFLWGYLTHVMPSETN